MYVSFVFVFLLQVLNSYQLNLEYARAELERAQLSEDRLRVELVGRGVERYLQNEGTFPVDLTFVEQASYTEYAHLIYADMGYETSEFTDSVNDVAYIKAVTFVREDPLQSKQDYLADNHCGTGVFTDSENWCGSAFSFYTISDNRDHLSRIILQTQVALRNVQQRILDSYSINHKLPNVLKNGRALANGEAVTLSVAVGYTESADSCTGNFNFSDVLLTCIDLYSPAGQEIEYIFAGPHSAYLLTYLPFKQASDGELARVIQSITIPE